MKVGKLSPVTVNSLVSLVTLNAAIIGCSNVENSNIPKKPADMTAADTSDPAVAEGQSKWEKLADALKIKKNVAADEKTFKAELGIPSLNISDVGNSTAVVTNIALQHLSKAYATRCAAIESMTKIHDAYQYVNVSDISKGKTDITGTGVYLMKYKLQKDATGAAEDTARSALVVMPTSSTATNGKIPLVVYGHGGDSGLTYRDVATVFGAGQAANIIIAPAFPGEGICKNETQFLAKSCDDKGAYAAAVGTSEPYKTDADELLGAQDCLVRAATPASAVTANAIFTGFPLNLKEENGTDSAALTGNLQLIVKRHSGTGFIGQLQLPVSYIMGASRGGAAAQIALAKSGAALTQWPAHFKAKSTGDSAKQVLGQKYLFPSLFSCSAVLFPPSTFMHAENRVVLEMFVKGLAKNTNAWYLPSSQQLDGYIDGYRKGTKTAEQMAFELATIDSTISAPLIVSAVQNWTKFAIDTTSGTVTGAAPGAMLMVHGMKDKIVSVKQSLFASAVFSGVSSALVTASKAPGVKFTGVGIGVAKEQADANGELIAGAADHGDAAFQNGLASIDFVKTAASGTPTASEWAGKTPSTIVGSWMASGDCAIATTP